MVFLSVSCLISCGFSLWQKLSWWAEQSEARRADPVQQALLGIFAATFALRLLCVFVHSQIVGIVCYDHVLLVDEFVRATVAEGLADLNAERRLLQRDIALQRDLRGINGSSQQPPGRLLPPSKRSQGGHCGKQTSKSVGQGFGWRRAAGVGRRWRGSTAPEQRSWQATKRRPV